MTDTLDDVLGDKLSADDVKRRVDDWSKRITDLFAKLSNWLPTGYSQIRSRTVLMHEELMTKFGVSPCMLPILDISRDDKLVASVEPRGLWIIGANGRLDLKSERGHFVIVDVASAFKAPSWKVAPFQKRQSLLNLNRSTFQASL